MATVRAGSRRNIASAIKFVTKPVREGMSATITASIEKIRTMDTATVIGYLASVLSIASFTPQAWKIIRSRDVEAISAKMYLATVTGFAMWTAFGVLKGEWPIIITNAVCFGLSAFILMMKLLPRTKRERVADTIDPSA